MGMILSARWIKRENPGIPCLVFVAHPPNDPDDAEIDTPDGESAYGETDNTPTRDVIRLADNA
jgi:hypothetical protein